MLECVPGRSCGPMERGVHSRAGLLADHVPTLEQPVPKGLHPMEETQAWAINKELQPVGRTQKFMENSCAGDPTVEQGKSVRSPSHEDEAA